MQCARCNYRGPFRVCGDGKTEGRLYGRNTAGEVHCDVCCAEVDKADMIARGKATLYLSVRDYGKRGWLGERYVSADISNWPGTLKFHTGMVKTGHHNMAGRRYDVWFTGPDGKDWHGVQYGDNTQILHCRRVKSR